MGAEVDVITILRHRLVSGGLVHGAKLKADLLRQEFTCSASTIREALFRLSTEGLVDFQEQRGFRVPEASTRRQHELTHIRILLESEGACLSARLGGVDWEAALAAAHHKLSHIESRMTSPNEVLRLVDLWSLAELEFHVTLISACASELLISEHARIYAQFRQQLVIQKNNYGYFPQNIHEHARILEAALNRDERMLRTRIHDHLKRNLDARQPLSQTSEPNAF